MIVEIEKLRQKYVIYPHGFKEMGEDRGCSRYGWSLENRLPSLPHENEGISYYIQFLRSQMAISCDVNQ
jgi:hypothetical protein